ncbi:MAG: hypothetical protein AAGA56_05720, partial [Myxococcota bacterium]
MRTSIRSLRKGRRLAAPVPSSVMADRAGWPVLLVAAMSGCSAGSETDSGSDGADADRHGTPGAAPSEPGRGSSTGGNGAEVGNAVFLGARIPGGETDVLEVTFSGPVRNVSSDDVFTNRTHALVKTRKMTGPVPAHEEVRERANEDGSFTYVFPLSDHVVPGETPELIYFPERSDLTDLDGVPLPAIIDAPIDVSEVGAYHGEKTLVRVEQSGTWNDIVSAMGDDTIVAIERGFVAPDAAPQAIDHEGLTLTAYGDGDAPRITLGPSRKSFFSLKVSALQFTVVGLHLIADGMNGIAFDE